MSPAEPGCGRAATGSRSSRPSSPACACEAGPLRPSSGCCTTASCSCPSASSSSSSGTSAPRARRLQLAGALPHLWRDPRPRLHRCGRPPVPALLLGPLPPLLAPPPDLRGAHHRRPPGRRARTTRRAARSGLHRTTKGDLNREDHERRPGAVAGALSSRPAAGRLRGRQRRLERHRASPTRPPRRGGHDDHQLDAAADEAAVINAVLTEFFALAGQGDLEGAARPERGPRLRPSPTAALRGAEVKGVTIEMTSVELVDAETATAALRPSSARTAASCSPRAAAAPSRWTASGSSATRPSGLSTTPPARVARAAAAARVSTPADLPARSRARPSLQVRPASTSVSWGRPEDALGDDVAQHLGRAAADGERGAEQEPAAPRLPPGSLPGVEHAVAPIMSLASPNTTLPCGSLSALRSEASGPGFLFTAAEICRSWW